MKIIFDISNILDPNELNIRIFVKNHSHSITIEDYDSSPQEFSGTISYYIDGYFRSNVIFREDSIYQMKNVIVENLIFEDIINFSDITEIIITVAKYQTLKIALILMHLKESVKF